MHFQMQISNLHFMQSSAAPYIRFSYFSKLIHKSGCPRKANVNSTLLLNALLLYFYANLLVTLSLNFILYFISISSFQQYREIR